MEMKNKLIKHHKTSMHFYLHDFALVLAFTVGLIALISVPTYITLVVTFKNQAQAAEKVEEEIPSESEELLTVVEEVE